MARLPARDAARIDAGMDGDRLADARHAHVDRGEQSSERRTALMATKKNATVAPGEFDAKDAERDQVPLWVALVGPSSSGKTKSALRLAEGMQRITGGDIHVVDTESKRAKHYA